HTLAHNAIARLEVEKEIYHIGLKGEIFVYSVTIANTDYVKDKEILLNSEQWYDHAKKTFTIKPSTIKVQQSDFDVKGYFTFGDSRYIDLTVDGKKGNIQTLLSLLPGSYNNLKEYNSKGQVYFTATIKGDIGTKTNPAINVSFGFSDASLTNPTFGESIENAFLTGTFSNGASRNTSTSELSLKNFKAKFKDKSFKGNFLIRNLDHPYVELDLSGAIDIESLLKFYPLSNVSNAKGSIDADIQFKGVLDHVRDKRNDLIHASGEMEVKDVSFTLKDVPYSFKGLNGVFLFNKNDVAISGFTGKVGVSDFVVEGFFKNVISYLLIDGQSILVDAELTSNYIDINELMKYSSSEKQKEGRSGSGEFPYMDGIDINLNCNIKHLSFDRFQPKNIKGRVRFNQPYLELQKVSFNIAGGSIYANTYVTFKSPDKIPTALTTNFSNLRVDSIFYVTDNFGQDFLTNKHLKGDLSGSLNLFFVLTSSLDIQPASIAADADFLISNGQLNNFEPMKKLSRFVEEKELENIRFSELKNKIYIKDEVITIPEMEIKSNVSNISVSGTHTFNNQMDYKLVVPLKNFKKAKQDKDEAFGAIEVTNTGSSNIFLSIKGDSDNFKISYDSRRTKEKIKEDLKKEKEEFKALFKKRQQDELIHHQSEEENRDYEESDFFDF
ncbi:MAG TPA: AsmA-like C-terminal region-containing protein, partial [Cytophagaceae bacterium]